MTNLDRCWKNCLRMWKWISENLPKGFSTLTWGEKKAIIDALKAQWLKENRFTKGIDRDCFFCDYANNRDGCTESCPGRLIRTGFHCNPPSGLRSYAGDPKGFYRGLLALDKERKLALDKERKQK